MFIRCKNHLTPFQKSRKKDKRYMVLAICFDFSAGASKDQISLKVWSTTNRPFANF
jgi:hypothetical protein